MTVKFVLFLVVYYKYASCRWDLPKLSLDYCTDNGLIEHKIGQDLKGCIELCARRRLCVSISYCRYSNLCTLRNNDEVPLSSDGSGNVFMSPLETRI